ncbi:PE family protein [Mycobacterium paragordonae]|uniref:PE family protein n=1 Tax=Mycobacterium paragordonae TaxID=1389713 RepID=UPI0009F4BBBB|nr:MULTISPECIES: PE family protein [Mycobacterium]
MSYVLTVPELVEAAVLDLAGLGSTLGEAAATAAVPTTAVTAAAADEVSTATSQLFGAHGQEFQALSARAVAFHQQFVNLLSTGAGQYADAEANARALLAGSTSPIAPAAQAIGSVTDFGGAVTAPYQKLFTNTVTNLQSLSSYLNANPTPLLRQFLANQSGYLNAIGKGLSGALQSLPTGFATLPLYVQNAVHAASSFNPLSFAQAVVDTQVGYLQTITTSLQAAGREFVTGLQALPGSLQAAGQALATGNFQGAFNNAASGVLDLFITGFTGQITDTGVVNVSPTGTLGDLLPIFGIPGQMAQNFTDMLPAGSVPAMLSENFTNVISTLTDTSTFVNLNVAVEPIPLHMGLPLVLGLNAIGPVITTGDAVLSSMKAFTTAVQTGDLAGATAAILGAPAVVADGFLNGQSSVALDISAYLGLGDPTPSTTYLPVGGILAPLQGGSFSFELVPGFPASIPLGGTVTGGIIPALLSYLPQQLAVAIGAAPLPL